jgi:hypothetical protein
MVANTVADTVGKYSGQIQWANTVGKYSGQRAPA